MSLARSGRQDGNEKGLKSKKRKEKELVVTMRALVWKGAGLYTGKEKETFKVGEQSLQKGDYRRG